MVTFFAYKSLEWIFLRISLALFFCVSAFLLCYIGVSFIQLLVARIRNITKWKMLHRLIGFMLEETGLSGIAYKRAQRKGLIEAFSTLISSIKGRRRERLKEAMQELGLVPYLERGLHRALPSTRMHSSYTLGIITSERSVPHLILKLSDPNPKVVSSCIIALGEMRDKETVTSLLSFFASCAPSHAWLVAAILPVFGPGVFDHVQPYFEKESLSPGKLILLTRVIASLQLAQSVERLEKLYRESEDLDVRIAALSALGKVNDLRSVKTAMDALSDKAWQIRAVGCNIIGEMAVKGAASKLFELLGDSNWFVRKNSARALVRIGRIGAEALFEALNSTDRFARDMAVQTLEENGIVDELVRSLKNPDAPQYGDAERKIRLLVEKGYVNYLSNYRSAHPLIMELVA